MHGAGGPSTHPSRPYSCCFSAPAHPTGPKALQPWPWNVSTKEAPARPCVQALPPGPKAPTVPTGSENT